MIEEENIEPVPGVKPGSFAAWCASFRPKTLGIAAAPVFVGLAVSAAVTHTFDIVVALATLALSLLMQAISNMENDAGYTKRKAERKSRKGLPRSTANGWLTVAQVERMIKILIGVVAGWLWKFLRKRNVNSWASLPLVGFVGSMVNTVLVMGSIYVLFAQQYAAAKDVAREAVFGLVMTTVAFNGIPEALAAAVLVAAIGKALLRVTRTQLQTA